MLLRDKAAIITGATSGIGMATVHRFLNEGASVLAVGRREKVLTELSEAAGDKPGRLVTLEADVTAYETPKLIVDQTVEAFGGVDILVNAAGIIGFGTIENTSDDAWDEMVDVNMRAPFRLMQAATRQLVRGGGAIVNVSSVTGLRSFPGLIAYCSSKAGCDHLTRCAALELAAKGVRVNAVNPGVVVTNLHRRAGMTESQYQGFLEHSKETHPIGRAGKPEEVADLILFLASDQAQWITGETLAIDGGRHLTCAR